MTGAFVPTENGKQGFECSIVHVLSVMVYVRQLSRVRLQDSPGQTVLELTQTAVYYGTYERIAT